MNKDRGIYINYINYKNIGYLEDYDGFVLYKEISLEKFKNINISNHAYLIKGLVIINKLNEFDLHATTVTFINYLITKYCCNIIIGPYSFQCPDGQIVRRYPNNKVLLFVHEINCRPMKLQQAVIKMFMDGNRFKAVALLFECVNSIVYPSYIVSLALNNLQIMILIQ
ncbi:hypothetical protein ACTFIY_008740 [Dictyostelium cf. discoideum]